LAPPDVADAERRSPTRARCWARPSPRPGAGRDQIEVPYDAWKLAERALIDAARTYLDPL
jgi:hypothetical protein